MSFHIAFSTEAFFGLSVRSNNNLTRFTIVLAIFSHERIIGTNTDRFSINCALSRLENEHLTNDMAGLITATVNKC